MAYLGNSPGVASQRVVTQFTATSGQTTFTPQSGYTIGYLDVFLNGVKLVNGDDYTASNGTSITLASGASLGDSVELVSFTPRGLSDGWLKSEADSRFLLSGSTTTTSIGEGTNLYYTDARARGSLSFTSGSGAYNSTTGVITIPTNNNELTNGSGYLTGNQTVTLSGDASGSGSTAITVTLANSGVVAGTYNNVTVNSKGLITSGSNTSYLTGNQTVTLSGDASGSGSTAITVTLATVGASKGGTGQTSLTANNVILGNGTSAVQFVAPGSSGNVLTSNGTTWTSTTPASTTTLTISNKTGAYTVVSGDAGTVINCTSGTFTVSLTAAATLGSGFNVTIWNTGTGAITIDPNGAETIDGVATLILRQGEGTQIVCDGTNWQTGNKKTMRGYAENFDNTITRPSASGTYSIAIGRSASASGSESVAIGTSTVAGTFSAAIGYSSQANGFGGVAIGSDASASSNYATAIGCNSSGGGPRAAASGATALGGSYAAATDSFAAAIGNNSSSYGATGTYSIALGSNSKATGGWSVAIGWTQTASGSQAVCLGGNSSIASGNNSLAIGRTNQSTGTYSTTIGNNNVASASAAIALGDGATSSIIGKFSYTGNARSTSGLSQTGFVVLSRDTTDATATALTSDTGNASTTNQVILPNNSAFAFSALIVARRQASGGTQSAAWKIEGLIRREGSAATTTLVNSATTVLDNTPGWTIAVSADTTNGGLAITATGAAATNIRWVATVQTSEVTYA